MNDECHRIRSGLGNRAACATHAQRWPCRVKALSLTRPWSELVVSGLKTVENRSWETSYRGWVVIHAAKSWDDAALTLLDDLGRVGILTDDDYATVDDCAMHRDAPTGYLGVVRLLGCHRARDLICTEREQANPAAPDGLCSHWAFDGSDHWEVADAHRFAEPIPGPGSLGLFEPSDDVIGRLRDEMWEGGCVD